MLNKLLKYDLKYMIKNMSIFYILAIFFAIVTRILFSIDQSVIVGILSKVSSGCMVAMIANILINTMMRSWVRFDGSIYKDEAYLTHTLPVTKDDIYNSKFIEALIFFLVVFAIILVSVFITYYSKDNWLAVSNYIKTITTGLNMSTSFFIIMFFVITFLEVFDAIQCGFLGIILGHKKNNKKVGYSFLFGFIAYIISQAVLLILVFTTGLFSSGIMDLFRSNVLINTDSLKILMILAIIFYLLIIWSMNIMCKKELNEGVNVE